LAAQVWTWLIQPSILESTPKKEKEKEGVVRGGVERERKFFFLFSSA